MAGDSELLCGNWAWDPVLRELRYYKKRGRKGMEAEPEAVERLRAAQSVTWHKWSQQPMQSQTGEVMGAQHSRIIVQFEGGGDVTLNEADRACAEKLARAIADSYGLPVSEAGAPGRRAGNLPRRDEMGRLVHRDGRTEVVLDDVAGEVTVTRQKRPLGKSRRTFRTSEIRRLELGYEVRGPLETFTVWALLPDESKIPLASYSGYEGWADPGEWREFAADLARKLGVPADVGVTLGG